MSFDVIGVVIASLAVYRVSLMLALEDGPFFLFLEIREKWARRISYSLYLGMLCPLCIGFWLSFLAGLFLYDGIASCLLHSLAIAGLQTFLTMVGGVPDAR